MGSVLKQPTNKPTLNMKTFIALCFLALAAADNAPYHPAPAYKEPAYPDTAPVYGYEYAVADDYSGANFGQNENRDGYATQGQNRVALPDGRTQIVTYNVADAYAGYVADVKYEGVAQFPKYEPKPAYHPAPKPVPAYHA